MQPSVSWLHWPCHVSFGSTKMPLYTRSRPVARLLPRSSRRRGGTRSTRRGSRGRSASSTSYHADPWRYWSSRGTRTSSAGAWSPGWTTGRWRTGPMIVGTQVRAKACPDLRPVAIPLNFFVSQALWTYWLYCVSWRLVFPLRHLIAKDYE